MRRPFLLLTLLAIGLTAAPASAQAPYSVPVDNPFVGTPGARGEIYVYGLRNPFRWSFDRQTGAMLIGDVGNSHREEVDYLPRAKTAGANLGWNCFEGKIVGPEGCSIPNHTPPIFDYGRTASNPMAITGGHVVRDPALPSFAGRYLFADFYTEQFGGEIQVIPLSASATRSNAGETVESLVSFGEDSAGGLYAVSLNGPIYRLSESAGRLNKTSIGTFNAPMSVAAVPGQAHGLFIAERAGIVRLRLGTAVHQFVDISASVSTGGEGGLLGVAAAPDYPSSGRLFLLYVDPGGDIRLDEVRRSAADPHRADPATRRNVITIEHSADDNHYGGQVLFGPDRYLYLSTGDGGGQGDPQDNAQNLGSLLGKVLRLDVHVSTSVPPPVGPSRDTNAPGLTGEARKRQRVLRLGGVVAYGRCSERCRVTLAGRLRIGKRSYGLRRGSASATAGQRVRLKARLTKRGRKALRKAVRQGRRPKVRIALSASDAAGNASRTVRRTVRVKR